MGHDLTIERMLARLVPELERSARALKSNTELLARAPDSSIARERIVAELRDTAARSRLMLEVFLDRRGL